LPPRVGSAIWSILAVIF